MATDLRWGGGFYISLFCRSSHYTVLKELLKYVHICQRRKEKTRHRPRSVTKSSSPTQVGRMAGSVICQIFAKAVVKTKKTTTSPFYGPHHSVYNYTEWFTKVSHLSFWHNVIKCWPISYTITLNSRYAIKWLLKLPPHIKCIVTLPCEMCLTCDGVFNDRFITNLLLFPLRNIWKLIAFDEVCFSCFVVM